MLENASGHLGGWPIREERLLTVHTLLSLLIPNTYLLQCHFKKVHTRNCTFIYKEDKRKARLDEKI